MPNMAITDLSAPIFAKKAWHVLLQGARCVICGEPIFLGQPPHRWGSFSFEHKVPQTLGGAYGRRNRAGSHNECNKARKDSPKLKALRPTFMAFPRPQQQSYKPLIQQGGGIWWST